MITQPSCEIHQLTELLSTGSEQAHRFGVVDRLTAAHSTQRPGDLGRRRLVEDLCRRHRLRPTPQRK